MREMTCSSSSDILPTKQRGRIKRGRIERGRITRGWIKRRWIKMGCMSHGLGETVKDSKLTSNNILRKGTRSKLVPAIIAARQVKITG